MRKELLDEYRKMAAEMLEYELENHSTAVRRSTLDMADHYRNRAAQWASILLALRALSGQQEGE